MGPTMWHAGMPEPSWDTIQNRLNAHFLQRRPWLAFQERLGKRVFYAFGDGWSWAAILESGQLGIRLYAPYGPTAINKTTLQAALRSLTSCARQQGATYVRVEPQGTFADTSFSELGLLPAKRNIQPHYTLVKDLTGSKVDLLASMTATNRNLYRTAAKKGLTIRSSQNPKDISLLLNMLRQVAKHNKITVHSDEYFTTMAITLFSFKAATLYIAELNKQPVASSLVFDSPTTRYYAHAAALYEARKVHPATPLVSQMIFDAKDAGQVLFDFYGIAPPDSESNHPWTGFTRFKKSFGGEPKNLHGTWELPIKKLRYRLYRTARSLRK